MSSRRTWRPLRRGHPSKRRGILAPWRPPNAILPRGPQSACRFKPFATSWSAKNRSSGSWPCCRFRGMPRAARQIASTRRSLTPKRSKCGCLDFGGSTSISKSCWSQARCGARFTARITWRSWGFLQKCARFRRGHGPRFARHWLHGTRATRCFRRRRPLRQSKPRRPLRKATARRAAVPLPPPTRPRRLHHGHHPMPLPPPPCLPCCLQRCLRGAAALC